jgi:inner membrane protein
VSVDPQEPKPAPAPWQIPRWGLLYVYACIGALSHLLLDYINAYGVRPFAPFSEKWYSWDIISIIEPLMLAFLILGLAGPALFGLINEEISSRRTQLRGRGGAIVALLMMVAFWAVRDFEHRRAIAALETFTYDGEAPLRASAYPYALNPFTWHGVVETDDLFKLVPVDSLNGEVDPQRTGRTRYKPEETPASLAAKKSYLGRAYLDWARYPITQTEQQTEPRKGYTVRFYDARYAYPEGTVLTGRVELDEKLVVIRQCVGRRCQ